MLCFCSGFSPASWRLFLRSRSPGSTAPAHVPARRCEPARRSQASRPGRRCGPAPGRRPSSWPRGWDAARFRQASAWDWTPVRTSRTRRTLNSGVNRRRVCMQVLLRNAPTFHYAPVQFLGGRSQKAPKVSACRCRSAAVMIASSALLELAEWIESRRISTHGGSSCDVVLTAQSPTIDSPSETIADCPFEARLAHAAATESPVRDPNPGSCPDPEAPPRQGAGGQP